MAICTQIGRMENPKAAKTQDQKSNRRELLSIDSEQ